MEAKQVQKLLRLILLHKHRTSDKEDINKQLLQELKEIKKDIKIIIENMPDKDMFLTSEEEVLLEESYIHEKNKQLISSQSLRKQLGI